MQVFLNMIKADADISNQILSAFNKIKGHRNQLLKVDAFTAHERFSLLECQKSINEIEVILTNQHTSCQDKIKQFELFLKDRWERIRKTPLSYPYMATSPLTHLCHGFARLLKSQAQEADTRCIYQFLMPTLQNVQYQEFDEQPTSCIDQMPLGCFILDETDASPIPLAILYKNLIHETFPGYLVWKKERTADCNEAKTSFNPYTDKVLKEDELKRLIHFSQEGRELESACENYLSIINVESGLIRQFFDKLQKDLFRSGKLAQGSETQPAEFIYAVIKDAQIYLDNLDAELKKKIFAMRDVSSMAGKTFGDIWSGLTEFTEEDKMIDELCTNQAAAFLERLLLNPENVSVLDSDLKKERLINHAQNRYDLALKNFIVRCTRVNSDSHTNGYYDHATMDMQDLKLIIELIKDSKFFNDLNPFQLTKLFLSIYPEVENEIANNFSRVTTEEIKWILNYALGLKLTITGDQICLLLKLVQFSDEVVDILIQHPIEWNQIRVSLIDETNEETNEETKEISLFYWLFLNKEKDIISKILKVDPGIINQKDFKGLTPCGQLTNVYDMDEEIFAFVYDMDEEIFTLLVEFGADFSIPCEFEEGSNYPFYRMIAASEKSLINQMLALGADVNYKDRNGNQAIHIMAFAEYFILDIISRTTDVNYQNLQGWTALHIAALNNCSSFAAELLKKGADVWIHDKQRKTPFEYAGNQDVLGLLFDYALGSENSSSSASSSVSSLAGKIGEDKKEIVQRIFHNLIHECFSERILEFPYLDIQLGLREAILSKNDYILELLVSRGADLEKPIMPENILPLNFAAQNGRVKVLIRLVELGASLDKEIGHQQTIRDWAIQRNQSELLSCIDAQIKKNLLQAASRGDKLDDLIKEYFISKNPSANIAILARERAEKGYLDLKLNKKKIVSYLQGQDVYAAMYEIINFFPMQFSKVGFIVKPICKLEEFENLFHVASMNYSSTHQGSRVIFLIQSEDSIVLIDANFSKHTFNRLGFNSSSDIDAISKVIHLNVSLDLHSYFAFSKLPYCFFPVWVIEVIKIFLSLYSEGVSYLYCDDHYKWKIDQAMLAVNNGMISVDVLDRLLVMPYIQNPNRFLFIVQEIAKQSPKNTYEIGKAHAAHCEYLAMQLGLNWGDLNNNMCLKDFDNEILMAAIENGNLDNVKTLLSFGMNLNKKANGEFPIEYAVRLAKLDIFILLLNHGVFDLSQRSSLLAKMCDALSQGDMPSECVDAILDMIQELSKKEKSLILYFDLNQIHPKYIDRVLELLPRRKEKDETLAEFMEKNPVFGDMEVDSFPYENFSESSLSSSEPLPLFGQGFFQSGSQTLPENHSTALGDSVAVGNKSSNKRKQSEPGENSNSDEQEQPPNKKQKTENDASSEEDQTSAPGLKKS